MRTALTALGIALILAGSLWALQGAGIVMWPAESFMLRERNWITYGIVTALIGVVMLALARRRRR